MLPPVVTPAESAARTAYARALDTGPAASWRAERDRPAPGPGTYPTETAEETAARVGRAAARVVALAPDEVRRILTAAGIAPELVTVHENPADEIPGAVRVTVTAGAPAETARDAAAALAPTHDVHRPRPDVLHVAHLADVIRHRTAAREAALTAGDLDAAHRAQDTAEAARALLASGERARHERAREASEAAARRVREGRTAPEIAERRNPRTGAREFRAYPHGRNAETGGAGPWTPDRDAAADVLAAALADD